MVLEFEKLTEEEVKCGYRTQGDLNGSYQDVIDYLAWTINTPRTDNAKHLKEAIETITRRFMPYVTTKYLRQFADSKDCSARLLYVLGNSGYTTTMIKQYMREMRSSKTSMKQTTKLLDGTIVEKTYTLGHTSYGFVGKVLQKVITKEEAEVLRQKFQEQNNKSMLMKDLKEAVKGNPYSPIGHLMEFETTIRTEKAIRKLQSKDEYEICHCKICKHEIKIPITAENNLVENLYACLEQEIKDGTRLCRPCQTKHEAMLKENNMFDMSGILKQLTELKGIAVGENKTFATPTLSFMMEFYMDIGLPSIGKVEKILDKAKESLELNCEIDIKLDKIIFRFN